MKKILLTMMISVLALTACGKSEETSNTETNTEVNSNADVKEDLDDCAETIVEQATTEQATEEQSDDPYVGEYLDYDNNDPNLFIKNNGNDTYSVEIGIFRLEVLEDYDAIVTDAGLEFEDETTLKIKGVITLEGNEAVVTITESSWDLIASGTVYRYYR